MRTPIEGNEAASIFAGERGLFYVERRPDVLQVSGTANPHDVTCETLDRARAIAQAWLAWWLTFKAFGEYKEANMTTRSEAWPKWGPATVKGEHIYNREGTEFGLTTGATRRCQMDGCGGERLCVRWPDEHITYPCDKGLIVREDRRRQIG